jgi:glucosamine 6-phosphate synthetase-like amidotransferase/phosphosugar isomerase protein
MCLIAYVPSGKVMPDDYITAAHQGNDDGIGIMSEDGIHKFLGRKALKRAKRYLKQLHEDEIEYAIHFRYATHGDVTMHNCHPH